MIFTNYNRNGKSISPPIPQSHPTIMSFSNQYKNHAAVDRTLILRARDGGIVARPASADNEIIPNAITSAINANKPKTMIWGEPTWFLFHTLAEKVKEDMFPVVREELFDIFRSICENLPCPICANHAKQYIAGIQFAAIQTKEQWAMLLHRFHNEVNKRKGFELFPYDQLSAKYSRANTVAIIHHFMSHFEHKGGIHTIVDDLFRARLASKMRAWFNKNIGFFDL